MYVTHPTGFSQPTGLEYQISYNELWVNLVMSSKQLRGVGIEINFGVIEGIEDDQ